MFGQPEHEVKRQEMRKCKKLLSQHPQNNNRNIILKPVLQEEGVRM
jgi:hypothetical protein